MLATGSTVLLAAFGGGLTWARDHGRVGGRAMAREGCALVTGAAARHRRGVRTRASPRDGWPVASTTAPTPRAPRRVVEGIAERRRAGDRGRRRRHRPRAVKALFDARRGRASARCSCLVNNAGIRADGLSPQIDDEDWDSVIDTNLSAAFHTAARRCGRCCGRASAGSSTSPRSSARGPTPGQANYAASKAGLIGMTRTVAVEVARRGDHRQRGRARAWSRRELTEDIGDGLREAIPARRAGTPEEIAACVRFLASDEAAVRDRLHAHRRRRPERLSATQRRRPTEKEN